MESRLFDRGEREKVLRVGENMGWEERGRDGEFRVSECSAQTSNQCCIRDHT